MKTLSLKIPLSLLLLALSGVVLAETQLDNGSENSFAMANAVDDSALDELRGGFITADGIRLDLGFQRSTVIDGSTEVQNTFHIQNIDVSGKDFSATISAGDLANMSTAMNTVIQNNLDNKIIQVSTTLDVTVKNLDVATLQQGLLHAESLNGIQAVQTLR